MDSPPTLDLVYQAVLTLYQNPNPTEKEKANHWLNQLQKSVYAWKIADEMLLQKRDLESCYFAAQTMRSKIQLSFHELPASSHVSLRDSLLDHISQINKNTNPIIVTQLSLALADFILQMATWQEPVMDLLKKFGENSESLWPLLEILIVLPEEVNSRFLRLGANRRQQIIHNFHSNGDAIMLFLTECVVQVEDVQICIKVLRCFTSWVMIHAIPLTSVLFGSILNIAFEVLKNNLSGSSLHETAADCVSVVLQILEEDTSVQRDPTTGEPVMALQQFQLDIFSRILELEQPYHISVAHEDMDKSINYCRIFTELGETFLDTIINSCLNGKQHYAIKSLDFALMCVSHHDYEVAQITFNLWYGLSELLYQRNNVDLTNTFKPHVERLITALCRHCQMEPDHLGLIDEGDQFADFRARVSELIKDTVFVIGSSHCFRQMFTLLTSTHGPNQIAPSWDMTESALFVMQAVAKNILPDENDVVPKVVEAILNLPENTHVAVRYTSILLLGELCDWISKHPQSMEPILNFLLACLNQKDLGSAASTALQSICSACPSQMASNVQGLLQIASLLDTFEISNEAANGLIKGISKVISTLRNNEVDGPLKELCWLQARPLCHLIEENLPIVRNTKTDPILWLDRLATIFRNVSPPVENQDTHPCHGGVNDMWPVLVKTCEKYQSDARIMERCCRCLRFLVRCLNTYCAHLLEPMVKLIIQVYSKHQHSCFLYVGSILVDIFGVELDYTSGLIGMLEAFLGPTFAILQETDGLKNHPDTVDDLFRLCTRFLQTCPVPFLHSSMINSILDCAILSVSLDHREANSSVMKFFCDLLHCGRSHENRTDRSDFDMKRQLVTQILQEKGQNLVITLIHSAVFTLSSYMFPDISEVLFEITLHNKNLMASWLEQAITQMPKENAGGTITATQEQLLKFHRAVLNADSPKNVVVELREYARLYR
ncbi:transportin-3 [Trichogramma pretiosum]|uniref:transportin-3 n=1 Tax=Trichogramma pretiosum TaxID=7493 RepID=UPI0006C99393|nr:transportin-3 [Trichogramma pretiosum]